MILLLLTLFFSDGTDQVQVLRKDGAIFAQCQAFAAQAKTILAGKPTGHNSVVVGVDARCIVVPKSNAV